MRLLPAAIEHFLCPPSSWRVQLRSPFPPTACAMALAQRRAKNVFDDVFRRPARKPSELRWTGSLSDDRFEIVEAGLAGTVRALGAFHAAPGGSTIEMTFRFETRQFIWDLLLLLVVGAYLLFASTISAFVAVGVVLLLVFEQLSRRLRANFDASRLVGLVQGATEGEISKTEGGAVIRPQIEGPHR